MTVFTILVHLLKIMFYNEAHAVNMGIPKEEASFLLSIIGICNMIGRIINGWLSDNPKVILHSILCCLRQSNVFALYLQVSVLFLNNMGLTVSGLLIMICPFCISYYQLLFFSIALGLFTCKILCLKISDATGLHTSSFCLLISLHRCNSTDFTWGTFGVGKCQQRLRVHARFLRSRNPLRNSYGWYSQKIDEFNVTK